MCIRDSPNAQSQFASTTRSIGEYMMRTSKNAGEFIPAFDPEDLGFAPITYPPDCDENASRIAFEKWKNRYNQAEDLTLKQK
eukprot:13755625-Ditylum_brightwellii.AAC.1